MNQIDTFTQLASDPAFVDLAAGLLSFFILLIYSLDFFKEKQYPLIEPSTELHGAAPDYAVFRPASPILLTSKIRYWIWFLAFFSVILIVWLVLSSIIATAEHGDFGADVPAYYAAFPQLVSVLLITNLSTKIPGLGKWLIEFRAFAHRRAAIPRRAIAIFNKLRDNDFRVSLEWRARIQRLDEPTVSPDDLINLDTSTESKWVASVYLLEWIRDRSTNAKSIWARRLADPALGYLNTKALLDDVKSRIDTGRADGARALDDDGRISPAVDQLHFQAAQLAVCLVFASTFSDSEAEREFRSIGVNVGEAIRTDLNVPVLLGSGTILGVLIYIALTFLGVMLDDVRNDDPSGLLWRTRAMLMAASLLAVPPVVVVGAKQLLSGRWIARSAFGPMDVGAVMIAFTVGCCYGVAVFITISYMGFLGPEEHFARWPFGLLSGGAAALAALSLERRPFVGTNARFARRALVMALVGVAVLAVLTLAALLMGAMDLRTIGREYLIGLPLMTGAVGLALGAWLSISLDYSKQFSSRRALLRQEIDRYIVARIDYGLIADRRDDDVQAMFRPIAGGLPLTLREELADSGLLTTADGDAVLTQKGLEELFLVATTHHE